MMNHQVATLYTLLRKYTRDPAVTGVNDYLYVYQLSLKRWQKEEFR